MSISREAAEAALQERVSHFQKFSHQTLARFCAELEREKLQLDFEWQDEFEELQRATAALREENATLRQQLNSANQQQQLKAI